MFFYESAIARVNGVQGMRTRALVLVGDGVQSASVHNEKKSRKMDRKESG